MKTVWIYIDTRHELDHINEFRVFATKEAAQRWFEENDPKGVAQEHDVIE
jgi:hypothetical protein